MNQQTLFNTPQQQLTSDDYYTPGWIFDKLQITFDIDVAAPTGGCHWIPAKQHFDQQTNGLTSAWHGNVFMNRVPKKQGGGTYENNQSAQSATANPAHKSTT
jgi:hypothetical protein